MHPVESYLAEIEAVHAKYVALPAWSMEDEAVATAVDRMQVLANQDQSLFLDLVAQADRRSLSDPNGYANTAGWLAAVTRSTQPEARRTVKLAHQLDAEEHLTTHEAMSRGEISIDQAAVIVKAVEELPDDLTDAGLRAQAEKNLVALAERHDPRELRILGRRILEVLAPDIADEALARALEAEEAHAAENSYFRIHPDGHGSMRGQFKVPLLAGRMLQKHVEAIAAPKHQNAVASAEGTIPKPWRLGAAFTEYIQTRPTNKGLPKTGGTPATVVVTMTLESLLGGLEAAAILDTGEAISAAHARRLACEAGIIPAVLGGKSEVLDLGRTRRLYSPPQRLALSIRYRTCIVDGCGRSAATGHFHHFDPWGRGGSTDLERGAPICEEHHAQIHDVRFGYEFMPNGRIRFYRRA